MSLLEVASLLAPYLTSVIAGIKHCRNMKIDIHSYSYYKGVRIMVIYSCYNSVSVVSDIALCIIWILCCVLISTGSVSRNQSGISPWLWGMMRHKSLFYCYQSFNMPELMVMFCHLSRHSHTIITKPLFTHPPRWCYMSCEDLHQTVFDINKSWKQMFDQNKYGLAFFL